jgi:hypothetical protein
MEIKSEKLSFTKNITQLKKKDKVSRYNAKGISFSKTKAKRFSHLPFFVITIEM